MGTTSANDLLDDHRLYVITLASADVPMPLHVPFVHELVGFTVFRSRSVKDGREHFRLHLGYFESEARAQEALGVVRRYYPVARIVSAPRSGLGSLDDTLNTEFRMIRTATARVVRREDFTLPPSSAATAADGVKPRSINPLPASEPQRYVVQLGWWARPVEPTAMPRLAVFRAFDLYSVRTTREGTSYQGARLGFFQNIDRARRVAEHIRSHYPRVGVVPVSHREYARVVELLRQRARQTPAIAKLQDVQPAEGIPSAASSPDRPTVTGPPPRAPLAATDSQQPRASEKQLILPELGDLKIGKPHDDGGNEALRHELHRVQQFLDLLAPREPKMRIRR
jgi:hypothetical protein